MLLGLDQLDVWNRNRKKVISCQPPEKVEMDRLNVIKYLRDYNVCNNNYVVCCLYIILLKEHKVAQTEISRQGQEEWNVKAGLRSQRTIRGWCNKYIHQLLVHILKA